MIIAEPINEINKNLVNHYGIETESSNPIWRVVWSEDQLEKRLGTFDDYSEGGIYLRTITEVREVPKYWYIKERYILERLVIVPDYQQDELAGSKKSYEPLWTFEDKFGRYLPPVFRACKFIIDTIYAAQYGPKNHSLRDKFADPEWCEQASKAEKERRLKSYEEAIFGEDSGLSGTTIGSSGNAIIVPQSYRKNS